MALSVLTLLGKKSPLGEYALIVGQGFSSYQNHLNEKDVSSVLAGFANTRTT
jgi:hypothetical protein